MTPRSVPVRTKRPVIGTLRVFSCFLLLAVATAACGPADTGGSVTTIGVSLLTRAHVFYRDLEEGLHAGAEEHGYRLLINAAEWDAGRQISQLEDFITRGVDAIVVCPVDSSEAFSRWIN